MMIDHTPFSDDAVPMAMVSEVGAETPQISVARGMRRKNGGVKVNSNSGEPEPPKIRSIFPETWLWDIVDIGLVFWIIVVFN